MKRAQFSFLKVCFHIFHWSSKRHWQVYWWPFWASIGCKSFILSSNIFTEFPKLYNLTVTCVVAAIRAFSLNSYTDIIYKAVENCCSIFYVYLCFNLEMMWQEEMDYSKSKLEIQVVKSGGRDYLLKCADANTGIQGSPKIK